MFDTAYCTNLCNYCVTCAAYSDCGIIAYLCLKLLQFQACRCWQVHQIILSLSLSFSLAVFVYCRLTFVVHLCRHSVSAKWVIHFDRKTELSLGSWIIQWGLSNVRMINACREIYIFRPCAVADNEIVVRRGVCLILINIFKPRHAVIYFPTSRNRGSIEELFLRRVRQAN